jgi:ABC-type transport system involved in cytochrome bd biosynthesis fused ATPase/permease subunit
MRLSTPRLRGITEAFPNDVCADFDGLGEGLIAIVGESGAGKSTLIGSSNSAQISQLVMTGHLNSGGVKDKLH